MHLDVADRVVVVTGGSSGIGYAIARAFAFERARVVIAARRQEPLEAAAKTIAAEAGTRVVPITADTTDQSQVDRMISKAADMFERLDVLVNCAANPGGSVRHRIEDLDAAQMLDDLNTKIVGYARCCKAAVPLMRPRRWGRIIHIGGLTGRSSATLSGLRNAALCHMTKSLSDQLGPDGITVNLVHPGVVRTPHLDDLFHSEARKRGCSAADVEASFVTDTPIRRILSVDDIAQAVVFLASSHASAITGESIAIDGGISRGIYF